MSITLNRSRIIQIAAAVLSLALVGTLVFFTSKAAFNSQTSNDGNSWSTGSVTLADDDSGSAIFSTGADGMLTGGQVLTKCIAVTYSGSSTSGVNIRMFGSAAGTLAPHLDLRVREGTGGGFGNCAGFSPTSTLYTGSLAGFAGTHSNFGNGASLWSPSGSPQVRTYELQITVQNTEAAQGKGATGSFTWEAQG